MGEFNPSNGLMRNALEATEQILPSTGFHYHDFVSESLTSLAEQIEQRSITRNAQRPVSQESKIGLGGTFDTDFNCEGHLHYLANLQKKYSTTNPATGVYVHKLSPTGTNTFNPSMMVEVWRDDDLPQVFKGTRVQQMTFNNGLRQFLQSQITLVAAMADYWDYPTQTAGTGGPNPLVRGLPNYTNWSLADHDLYIKCTEASSFTFAIKIGAAASYGSTTMVMDTAQKWYDLIDSNDTGRIGDKGIKVMGYFPNFTSLADNDEWKWSAARQEWTPVFPSVLPFNEVYSEIFIDGDDEPFRLNSINMTITRPVSAIYSLGGRYPVLVRERGRRQVGGTISREYLDVELRKKLERAESFYLRSVSESKLPIGSTAYYHTLELIAPLCMLSGPTPSIGSETQMDENLTFTCHPDPTDGDGNVDDVTAYVTNTIADITA